MEAGDLREVSFFKSTDFNSGKARLQTRKPFRSGLFSDRFKPEASGDIRRFWEPALETLYAPFGDPPRRFPPIHDEISACDPACML